ncbi:MAG TPA: hypothetical protein VFS43_00575 [Polyangiaceae bacterium]|nr:hypothetical protein [Polyangiaceae bacterium]
MPGWHRQKEQARGLALTRVLCAINVYYAYLDIHTSDSPLGNGLYQGPASLAPAFVDVAVVLAFAYLGTRRLGPPRLAQTA